MNRLNQYIALTVLGVLVVVAAGWFLLVSPQRAKAAEVRASVAQVQSDNAVLVTKLRMLRQERDNLPRVQAELAAVAAKIPDNRALPALIRSLTTVTTGAGVDLLTITPAATTVAAPTAAAAAPVAPVRPTAGLPRVSSVAAGQLGTIPVSLAVVGSYFNIERFLNGLEGLPRAMRVTSVSLATGGSPIEPPGVKPPPGLLTASIQAQVFQAVGRAAAIAVPGAPTVPVLPGSVPTVPAYPSPRPSAPLAAVPSARPTK